MEKKDIEFKNLKDINWEKEVYIAKISVGTLQFDFSAEERQKLVNSNLSTNIILLGQDSGVENIVTKLTILQGQVLVKKHGACLNVRCYNEVTNPKGDFVISNSESKVKSIIKYILAKQPKISDLKEKSEENLKDDVDLNKKFFDAQAKVEGANEKTKTLDTEKVESELKKRKKKVEENTVENNF